MLFLDKVVHQDDFFRGFLMNDILVRVRPDFIVSLNRN